MTTVMIIFLVVLGWVVNWLIINKAIENEPNGAMGMGLFLIAGLVPFLIPVLWCVGWVIGKIMGDR